MQELYQSFLSLPVWVKIWMLGILIPVNMIGLLFLGHEVGVWIAILGLAGMIPNLFVMYFEKAFSKTMAVSHIIPWTALVIYLGLKLAKGEVPEGNIYYAVWAVLIVDSISLLFDYKETREWFQERREKKAS